MSDPTPGEVAAYKAAAEGTEPEPQAPAPEPAEEAFLGTYRTREAAEAGIAEKDRYIEQLKAEREEALQTAYTQQAQQQQAYAPQAAQAFADGTPIYDLNSLQGMVDQGSLTEFQANAIFADQQARLRSEEQASAWEQRYSQDAPIRDRLAAREAIDEVKSLLGADADRLLHENRDAVAAAIQADGGYYTDPSSRAQRVKQAVLAAEFERQHGQPRDDQGRFAAKPDVDVLGGSGAAPTGTAAAAAAVDPDDPRNSFRTQKKTDAFGTIPGYAGVYQQP